MHKLTAASYRFALVALLHAGLVFLLFQCWHSARPAGPYFPTGAVFGLATIAVIAFVLLVPIFRRGDFIQRVVAGALVLFPVFCFGVAFTLTWRLL